MAREMKDSGVKWIGEIPENWQTKKLKYVAYTVSETGLNGVKIGLENIESKTGKFVHTDTEYDGVGQIVHKDDIVYGKLRPYLCKAWKAEFECNAVGDFYVFRCNNLIDSAFIQKVLVSEKFNEVCTAATYGTKMPRVSLDYINSVLLPLPPFFEQQAIADFLDGKCAEIDGVLADLEAEVKTLSEYKKSIISEVTTQGLNQNVKKKQSGIDWVGNIPAHWQVVPFRSYVVERAEKNLGGRNKNLLALSFALGVTRYADKKYNMDRVKEDFSGYQIVHEKDLVLSPNDIIKGSIFVSEYKGCISPMYRVFSNYDPETYNLYYLSYHLRTKESGRKFFYIARGLIGEILDNGKYVTRRMSVSQQDLLKFKVLLPPIEEQNEIVRYLDEKCASIEQSLADKQTQIETLKSYKASLIYEYVTGKKQVI